MWLVFTDLHLNEYKAFATVNEQGLNTRLLAQVEIIKKIRALIKEHQITTVFFLGDLFHSQAPSISKIIYNIGFYLVQSIASLCPVYLLTGNHDIFLNVHMFTPFTSIPNVHVINMSRTIQQLDNRSVDLIPWGGNFRKARTKIDYCFGHFGLEGAQIHGTAINDIQMVINPKSLQAYKLVLAGHYHTRQQVADNAFHIGAVMANTFSDTAEERGVWLINPTDNTHKFIPIVSPKFYTVELNTAEEIETFFHNEYKPDNYYKLIITQDTLHIDNPQSNIKVEYNVLPTKTEIELVDTNDIINLQAIVEEFIDNSNTALDKSILKQKAIDLITM